VVRLCEIFIHRAKIEAAAEGDVGVAAIRMQHAVSSAASRLFRVGHDWQGLPGHLDQLERVLREVAAFRDHGRHRLADMAHAVHGDAHLLYRWVGETG